MADTAPKAFGALARCVSPEGTAMMLREILVRGALRNGDMTAIEIAVSMLENGTPGPVERAQAAIHDAARLAQAAGMPHAPLLLAIAQDAGRRHG